MVSGCCETIAVAPGVQLAVSAFSDEERQRFLNDYGVLGNMFTRFNYDPAARHAIRDIYDKYRDQFYLFAQAAKNDIDGAGTFQGINATSGFGMRVPRPDDLVPIAQTRTFEGASNGVALAWSGLWHDGAISAAYGASPLYMRRQVAVAIAGFMENWPDTTTDRSPLEEMQWEVNGKPLPVWNLQHSFGPGGDLKIFEAPQVMYLKPRQSYRSQYKTGNALVGTDFEVLPIGISFVTADVMRMVNTQEQPTNTPP